MSEEQREVNGQTPEPAVGQPQETPTGAPAGTMQPDAVMVFLSYFGIFALIPLLTVKDNDFVRWHAKQGITFLAATIAVYFALTIITIIFGFIPVLGQIIALLLSLVMGIGGLAIFVLWVMALVKAFGGERWRIPLVADLSEKW